jgi:hypothetical protein
MYLSKPLMNIFSQPLNLSNMYKSNSDLLVQAFTNKELKTLVMALAHYNTVDVRDNRSNLMEKLVNGFLRSNDLMAEVIDVKPNSNAPMGSAAYKAWEAMYESDVRAHS